MAIIQIVPNLPPAIDGVGDYALNLARQIRKEFSIETHFLVGKPTWKGLKEIEKFSITQISQCSAASLLSLLPRKPTVLILHYVGYGYAKKGCPFWLVDGLQLWCAASENGCLITMFHEIAASGSLLTSAFWLSSLQRKLAAHLIDMSTHCFTSKQSYAQRLNTLSRSKNTSITTLPVFSTIGEPEKVPLLAERHRRLVVFGSSGRRLRAYQSYSSQLSATCQKLEIEQIWDIGPSTGLNLSTVRGIPIVEIGEQTPTEISHILLHSLAGFLEYNPHFLAKSTVFAAYSAHGLLPVISRPGSLPVDGIEPEKHYWVPDGQETGLKNMIDIQVIVDNAYRWYQSHNLSVQARIFAGQILKFYKDFEYL